ncbi:MAG: hypothetical protein ACYC2T_11465 [Bacillota bacterium]
MRWLKHFVKDQKGAVTTVEIIGYTLLIGGAVTLIGFALSVAYRGLAGTIIQDIQNASP